MEELSQRIAEIRGWDRARCSAAWDRLTGSPPHSGLSVGFLRQALAFELQCKEMNGHSVAVKRQLRGAAPERRPAAASTPPNPSLTAGTQLVREWNGRVYRVLVTEAGFEMDDQTYSSLSAIAKRITGAEWSGPRFFGLKRR